MKRSGIEQLRIVFDNSQPGHDLTESGEMPVGEKECPRKGCPKHGGSVATTAEVPAGLPEGVPAELPTDLPAGLPADLSAGLPACAPTQLTLELTEADAPKADAPKGDSPEGDTSRGDASKGDSPEADAPKGDTPAGDFPEGDTSRGDASKGDTSEADAPKADTAKGDIPEGDLAASLPFPASPSDCRDPVLLARNGLLFDLLTLYLDRCGSPASAAPSMGKTPEKTPGKTSEKPLEKPSEKGRKNAPAARFPNPAGFCRFLGVGMARLSALAAEQPDVYDALCAVFEDEALNSGVSASVLTPYFKKRLGYAEREAVPSHGGYDDGTLRVLFEHDILEDGA